MSETPADHHPRRPPARRRPLRRRTEQGPSRAGRPPSPRSQPTYLGTSHRQKTVKIAGRPAARGPLRAVRPARGLRGRDRKRRLDGVLGGRDVRPGRATAPSSSRSASSGRSSRRRSPTRRSSANRPSARPTPAAPRSRAPSRASMPTPLPHNETSTGVAITPTRVAGADDDALMLFDATSGAGGLARRPARVRRLLLRAAEVLRVRRRPVGGAHVAERRSSARARSRPSGRYIPAFLDLQTAIDNSRLDQTYNTPALAT